MRVCELTGKRRNVGYSVSHAHNKTKKVQQPNLQKKRIFLPDEGRYVRLTLCTRAIRSINRMGLKDYCRKLGIDYRSLVDAKLA